MIADVDMNGETEVYSFVKDNLNSVKLILDEKNAPVQFVNYSAYGETQILNVNQRASKLPNPFYYTSRELEPETGDYFYRARYYNPRTGRFISEDPLRFDSGDNNFYKYVKNNPLTLKDSYGLSPNEDLGGGVLCSVNSKCCNEDTYGGMFKCIVDDVVTPDPPKEDPNPPEDPPKQNEGGSCP